MKTPFYILEPSVNSKVIGTNYPQCAGLAKHYKTESSLSLSKFAEHKGLWVDYHPELDGIKIYSTTKWTDFISCSLGPGNDSIISERMFQSIQEFSIGEIQSFDCFIYKSEERKKYKWIHYIYSLERKVDYNKSIFDHPDKTLLKEIKKINNYDDFLKFYDTVDRFGLIRAEKTVIKTDGHQPDFFIVGRFNQKLYVSERLADKIGEAHYTGIEFTQANDILFG